MEGWDAPNGTIERPEIQTIVEARRICTSYTAKISRWVKIGLEPLPMATLNSPASAISLQLVPLSFKNIVDHAICHNCDPLIDTNVELL
jgi:hypothetical protein